MLLLAGGASACATAPVTVSPSTATTAASATASPGGSAELEQFRAARDVICKTGSDAIAAINATIEGASPADQAAALRRVSARIKAAQAELDTLIIPAALAAFVAADTARRTERLRLVEELAQAIEVGDDDTATSVDAELNELNITTEAEEDGRGLLHCP